VNTSLHEPILGDQQNLEQVLANLAVNAIHAMPDGGVLALELAEETGPRRDALGLPSSERFARLTVRDTGCGIPPDVLPQIFEPLFTTKRTGTGLGLAIVKRIVESQGGAVTVESSGTTGTAFHVLIPIAPAPGVKD
jgi:signal transduction histidine kinase